MQIRKVRNGLKTSTCEEDLSQCRRGKCGDSMPPASDMERNIRVLAEGTIATQAAALMPKNDGITKHCPAQQLFCYPFAMLEARDASSFMSSIFVPTHPLAKTAMASVEAILPRMASEMRFTIAYQESNL